jgi:hypothetical protein
MAPHGEVPVVTNGPQNDVAIRIMDAPFSGVSAGRKAWSLWAAQIDVIRVPGVELVSTQRAVLTDIRSGKLFPLPTRKGVPAPPNGVPGVSQAAAGDVAAVTGTTKSDPGERPIATFSADSGVYAVGELEAIPPEIELNDLVQWQFKLAGNVSFVTRNGDRLHSSKITIFEMMNRRTRKMEQRVLCDDGAKVTHKDAQITANHARYSPEERSVECLDGVRSVTKDGWFQTDRLFWSLRDRTIFCPDPTSGENNGSQFAASSLSVDLARRKMRAGSIMCRLKALPDPDLRPARARSRQGRADVQQVRRRHVSQ